MPVRLVSTPLPWAQSDTRPDLVFADSKGMIDVERPVASFKHVEDARRAVMAVNLIETAIQIIETERQCLFEGHQVDGVLKVEDDTDQIAVDAIANMDEWLADAHRVLDGGSN